MPLHNLIGLGETDSTALLFCREVELENFVLNVRRNPSALVVYFDEHAVFVAARHDIQGSTRRHGLNSIEHDVEESLLDEVAVHLDVQGFFRQFTQNMDTMLLG